MGDGGQLAGVCGFGDSGHPETRQIRWNDLQALAKSLGYQNGNRELVGVAFPVVAPWLVVWSSPTQSSSMLFDEQRAWGGRVAHRDAIGMERDVRGASGASRRWQWRLEREGGCGEGESDPIATKKQEVEVPTGAEDNDGAPRGDGIEDCARQWGICRQRGDVGRAQRKGEKMGARLELYRRAVRREKEGERG